MPPRLAHRHPAPLPRARTAVVLAGFGFAGLAACGEPPPLPAPVPVPWVAPSHLPPGTVLTVNGLALTGVEVDALAGAIHELHPEYARTHARRLALTGELLPRLAGPSLAPAAWQAAYDACAAFDPATVAPGSVHSTRGNATVLGVGLWHAARTLEPGRWSEPLELFGRFLRLRLRARTPAEDARREELELEWVEFAYLDGTRARELLQEALDRAELVIIDPAWRECVPEAWQHRMRPESP